MKGECHSTLKLQGVYSSANDGRARDDRQRNSTETKKQKLLKRNRVEPLRKMRRVKRSYMYWNKRAHTSPEKAHLPGRFETYQNLSVRVISQGISLHKPSL